MHNPQTRSAIYATAILDGYSAGTGLCEPSAPTRPASLRATLPRVTTPVAKLNRELFPGLDEQVAAIEEMKL